MSRGTHLRSLIVVVVVISAVGSGGALGAVKAVDLSGTWNCCGSGGAAPQEFEITDTSGALTGTGVLPGGTVFASITGNVSGDSVRIVTTYTTDAGYVATFTGTVSGDGSTMSGSWESNQQQSGTWTASLAGGASTTPTTEPPSLTAQEQQDLDTVDADADSCQQTLDSDDPDDVINGPLRRLAGARSLASAATVELVNLPDAQSAGDYLYKGALFCLGATKAAGSVVSYVSGTVLVGTGGAVVVSGTAAAPATLGLSALAGEVGGAGMIGLGIGTIGAGQALSSSASATMKDPPAADYRTIATPGPARGLAFPPASGSLGRTFATAKQLTIEFARAGDLSDALQLSVDRAGGAKAARNELWEGRQIRAAIGYIHQLRLTMHQIRISIPRLLQETSGPAFHPVVSAAEIEAAKKAARLGQFSPKLLTTFAKDGISETALRAGILALPDRTIKVNLVGAIANPALVPYLKILDAGFALYTKVPQIVAESKLR